MESIQDILNQKFKFFKENPRESFVKIKTDYNKDWNNGVNSFMIQINKDRKRENLPPISFMAVRQKLVGIKEIDDLRWFYKTCKEYSFTKDKNGKRNTFSKCFFGALK